MIDVSDLLTFRDLWLRRSQRKLRSLLPRLSTMCRQLQRRCLLPLQLEHPLSNRIRDVVPSHSLRSRSVLLPMRRTRLLPKGQRRRGSNRSHGHVMRRMSQRQALPLQAIRKDDRKAQIVPALARRGARSLNNVSKRRLRTVRCHNSARIVVLSRRLHGVRFT